MTESHRTRTSTYPFVLAFALPIGTLLDVGPFRSELTIGDALIEKGTVKVKDVREKVEPDGSGDNVDNEESTEEGRDEEDAALLDTLLEIFSPLPPATLRALAVSFLIRERYA